MARNIVEALVGDLEDKRRYREYKARVKALPPGYRETAAAVERYVMHLGPSGNGKTLIRMLQDLADLMEASAADGVPIRSLVGEDPVDFAETFLANYDGGSWIRAERARLTAAVDDAAGDPEKGPGA